MAQEKQGGMERRGTTTENPMYNASAKDSKKIEM